MIERFADPNQLDPTRIKQMKYLHFEMLKKYQLVYQSTLKKGKEELDLEYMTKAGAL